MIREPPRRWLNAALMAAIMALSAPVAAQQADEPRAQALFQEGRIALEKGDFATACARFADSLAIVKRSSTLLNLAQCEQEQGKLVSASRHWQKGIDLLPPDDPRLAISKERAAALSRRLPHLTLKLTGQAPPGTRVVVDGAEAKLEELSAGAPADPGKHTIVLFVPGGADQRATVDLAEGDAKTVMLVVPEHATQSPPGTPGNGRRTAGFVLGGVGVAGILVAGVTGGILVSKHSQINDACPGKVCTAKGRELINGLGPLNVANAVGLGVGLAGLTAGVILVVTSRGGNAETTVAPTALPGGGGLSMMKAF